MKRSHLGPVLASSVAVATAMAACGGNGGSGGSTHTGTGGMHASSSTSTTGGAGGQGGGNFITSSGTGGMQMQGFDVQPSALQTITVNAGQTMPTVTYTATLDGSPISAGWGVDKGNIGSIPAGPSTTADFTPTGKAGGMVTISAGLNMMTVTRQVMVALQAQQNGPDPTNPAEGGQIATDPNGLKQGGGVGGVGGEGLGAAVTDPATLSALGGTPAGDGSAQGLKFLYPYNKTVWPRGLPAPLLMWDWSLGDADAIQIELTTTTGSFSYKGTFARPAILAQTGGKFIRHPIPQDIWDMATNSAGGTDQLTVKLTVALGGQAYGPIQEAWTIAETRLSGTIYYNSYGTSLAKHYFGAVGGDKMFGGAVLSIRAGDPGPKLVAGGNSTPGTTDASKCRVCHSVAAFGSRLVSQWGNANDVPSSAYDLTTNGVVEASLPNSAGGFPGMYPDGSKMLTGAGQLWPLPNDTTAIPTTGLPGGTLGAPAFSPDGKQVTFTVGSGQQLVVLGFDPATNAFSNQTVVADDTGQAAAIRPGWPAFFPDGKSVVFQQQSVAGADGAGFGTLPTRKGSKGQLAWTNATDATSVTPLDQLNGKGYLPKLASPINLACTGDGVSVGGIDADHANDVDLNYEPTVNPIASGGYAWVVFTSRRMYGSVANIPPFCSDPRGVDLVTNITPKKLWVAAIDLSGAPGTDASHPAFYLPGQELLAGNSRGFWVLDPCRQDGTDCDTGDQCCNGFCEPNGNMGQLVCSNMPPNGMCSGHGDKCMADSDCCDPKDVCINGFCTQKGVN